MKPHLDRFSNCWFSYRIFMEVWWGFFPSSSVLYVGFSISRIVSGVIHLLFVWIGGGGGEVFVTIEINHFLSLPLTWRARPPQEKNTNGHRMDTQQGPVMNINGLGKTIGCRHTAKIIILHSSRLISS